MELNTGQSWRKKNVRSCKTVDTIVVDYPGSDLFKVKIIKQYYKDKWAKKKNLDMQS